MEIGGYLEMESFSGQEYHEQLIAVNNARCALLYLLKARGIKELHVPYYLCESVVNLCKREGYSVSFYHIGTDFLPLFPKELEDGAWIYIVNYFGRLNNDCLRKMQKRWGRIIVDNVQAFFQKPLPGVDTVYSCRKFFGVPDGGYVSTDAVLSSALEIDVSKDRMKHILGRFEGCASDYYADFKANDHGFVQQPLRYMSELTHNLLRAIDYDAVRAKREENYAVLENAFGNKNRLRTAMPIGPYCYPLYCENGMAIKKKLAEKKIYVPTLWPNVLTMEGTLEKDFAENILPLPCDQRYSTHDMNYMIQEVLSCIN